MQPHYHKVDDDVASQSISQWKDGNLFVACFHRCRTAALSIGFWVGLTIGFMPEHFLWEKVWPFYLLTHWMGL